MRSTDNLPTFPAEAASVFALLVALNRHCQLPVQLTEDRPLMVLLAGNAGHTFGAYALTLGIDKE